MCAHVYMHVYKYECIHVSTCACYHVSTHEYECMHACMHVQLCTFCIKLRMCIPASLLPNLKGQVYLNMCMLCSEEEQN